MLDPEFSMPASSHEVEAVSGFCIPSQHTRLSQLIVSVATVDALRKGARGFRRQLVKVCQARPRWGSVQYLCNA